MRWTGYVARMGERSGTYGVLVEKPEGKRPLVRPRLARRIILKLILNVLRGRGLDCLA